MLSSLLTGPPAAQPPFPWHRDVSRKTGEDSEGFALDVLLRLMPSCGEASATWIPELALSKKRAVDPETGEIFDQLSEWSQLDPDVRDALNQSRSIDRSSSEMRRFMVHNRLTTMWVLTLAEAMECTPQTFKVVTALVAAFVRRLRRDFFRGKPFPYLYSLEVHPGGHGWHVNFFLRKQFIDKKMLQRCWGNGNVWYTDFTEATTDPFGRAIAGARRAGGSSPARSARRGARRAAAYGAKYAMKDWGSSVIGENAHRYERSEGFPVPVVVRRFNTFADAEQWLSAHPSFGALEWAWWSDEKEDWLGPPCRVYRFDAGTAPPRRVKGSKKPPI